MSARVLVMVVLFVALLAGLFTDTTSVPLHYSTAMLSAEVPVMQLGGLTLSEIHTRRNKHVACQKCLGSPRCGRCGHDVKCERGLQCLKNICASSWTQMHWCRRHIIKGGQCMRCVRNAHCRGMTTKRGKRWATRGGRCFRGWCVIHNWQADKCGMKKREKKKTNKTNKKNRRKKKKKSKQDEEHVSLRRNRGICEGCQANWQCSNKSCVRGRCAADINVRVKC